ncbi:hypothetical protein HAX54_044096 [Datura stramonium]|uniref:Protein FAR1-RELATED SEQUENCE n=1 Tax=Datura stramonium TaxID=4076 RepID=A0ABS8W432_DATST|nr:hypothetical protein [Datura stramonium]
MDGLSLNTKPIIDDETGGIDIDEERRMTEYAGQSGVIEGKNPAHPDVGMEFETYEDVYYFYNCYAKVQGFGVRAVRVIHGIGRVGKAVVEVLLCLWLIQPEGFLCRHALCVLSQNGLEEIPPQHIL